MKKELNIGLYIMIGLSLLGLFIFASVGKYRSYDRVVSVKGLSEKEVSADNVTWPVAYKLVGNDLVYLYKEIKRTNLIIEKFLLDNGISKEDIYINAPEVLDLQADRYAQKDGIYRYNVTSVLTISSSEVEKVRETINKQAVLLEQGIALYSDYNYLVTYEYTGLNDIKPQMIEEATKNARAAADKFAEDSKSSLGRIKRASQGVFSVTSRDRNTPYIKRVRVVTSIDYYLK